MWKVPASLVWVTWVCGVCVAGPGIWHGVDDKTGNTTFFLYLDDAGSSLYTPQWERIHELAKEADHFEFRLPYKSYGMKCEGKLSGGRITGTWQIHQVQYVINGTWTANQVVAAEKWVPDAFLDSGTEVDIASRIARDFDDYDAFVSFWNQNVEPEFFALLAETFYADAEGVYRSSLKKGRLTQVYEALRTTKRFSACAGQIVPGISQARQLLRENYPWIASDIAVVSTFSLGGFDYRLQKFANRYMLLIGVDWIAKSCPEKEVVGLLAEALISSFHFRTLPLGSRGQNEIIRRSIATYTLERLDKPELQLYAFSGGAMEAPVAASKQRVREHLTARFGDFYSSR
ncbi:MAG: hypothetical protein ACWGQW_23630, partial [bacterium]